jgi:transposase
VQQFLAEKDIPIITQPPYPPDLSPSDFWLFPTLKMGLKRKYFAIMEDIKFNVTAELWKILNEAFCLCFQQRQYRYSKCARAQGFGFQGD